MTDATPTNAQVEALVQSVLDCCDAGISVQLTVAVVGKLPGSSYSPEASGSIFGAKVLDEAGERFSELADVIESVQTRISERSVPATITYIGSSAKEFRQLDARFDTAVTWLPAKDARSLVDKVGYALAPDLLLITGSEIVWSRENITAVLSVLTCVGTIVVLMEGPFATLPEALKLIDERIYSVDAKIPMPSGSPTSVGLVKGGSR